MAVGVSLGAAFELASQDDFERRCCGQNTCSRAKQQQGGLQILTCGNLPVARRWFLCGAGGYTYPLAVGL